MYRYSTKQFSYDKPSCVFVAESSDLYVDYQNQVIPMCGWRPGNTIPREFEIVSERTGRVVVAVYHHTERRDDEVIAWHFTMSNVLKVIVFND